MGALIRAHRWEQTSLGPPESWPQSLRSALSICLGASFQIAIYWGDDLSLLYNDAWSPILGLKHPSALGCPAHDVWPEIWPTIGPMFEQVFQSGEGIRSQDSLLAMHRHGFTEECYFDYTFSPIRNEAGRVGGIFNAVVETTFRVIGERRTRLLRDLGEQLAAAQSVSDVCAAAQTVLTGCSADLPFCLIYLNATDGGTNGLDLAAAVSIDAGGRASPRRLELNDGAAWPFDDTSQQGNAIIVNDLSRRFGMTFTGGPWPEPCETAMVLALGRTPDLLGGLVAGVSPRLSLDNEYRAFLERIAAAISHAISRARALEHQRARARELADIDRAKTVFFSNVSHELRTPLTLMLGPIEEAIRDDATPSRIRTELELAHRNSMRLLKLVNSLLDFSRIEAGRLNASFEATDLAGLTRDVASSFRAAFERAGLDFVVDCPDLGEAVYVDQELWEKIVLNLLSNAFKFTLEGSVRVLIRREGQNAVLEVTDTGVGVPEPELPRLFERFHRVDNTRARTHEGTGIGLALVLELVTLHGGSIEAASEMGSGTTFTVRVPLGHEHLAPERIKEPHAGTATAARTHAYVEEALRWLPDDAPGRSQAPLALSGDEAIGTAPRIGATRGARILVADDNADMRDYLRRLLERHYVVVAVPDGIEALESVRRQRPDLILTDVMMPRLDGFGLLRALRGEAGTASIPVIMLSARAGEEATVEGFDAGADDYLVKPFSARELLARISGTLALAAVRREAAQERQHSEERFRAVQDASPDGFHVLAAVRNADNAIVDFSWLYVNEAAAALGRQPREAYIGQQLLDLFPGYRHSGLFEIYRRVVNTGLPWIGEMHFLHDGHDALMRLAVARVANGVAVSMVDISERRRAELALKLADQRKDEFLATLAHELRNPLAPIRQAARIVSMPGVTDAQRRWSNEIINRQTQHMAMLLDDLLDLSRITRGTLEVRKASVELLPIIETAIETARPLIESRHHTLEVDVQDKRMLVVVDSLRIAQALANLLTNAAKYTDPGGHITLRVFCEGPELFMVVSDDGIGIPADNISTVFEMFSQVKSAIDRSEGGLGIGLALVKGVVQLHGGRVSATSGGNRCGSTFTIALPLESPRPEPATPEAAAERRRERSRCRILVVDDNRDAAETLTALMELEGHEARVALDAEAALDMAAEFKPEVALLDIGMPGTNGYELAQRMRATSWGKESTLIAITGWGQAQDRNSAIKAGFDHHLTKPVDVGVLLRLVGAAVEAPTPASDARAVMPSQ